MNFVKHTTRDLMTAGLSCVAIVVFSLSFAAHAHAHAVGENYVFLEIQENVINGHFEIHTDDLKQKLSIDIQSRGKEHALDIVNETAPAVQDYIQKHFTLGGDGNTFAIQFTEQGILNENATFAQYFFNIPLSRVPDILEVQHEMLYEDDRFHRGLLLISYNAKTDTEYTGEHTALIFSQADTRQELDLRQEIRGLLYPRQFIWQGIMHIWIGLDHILFLVVLLLPAVLRHEEGRWVPLESFSKAMWNVLKIVTLFTIAHSITLSLAAIEIIRLPGQLVESAIAASIVLVAANNIFPRFKEGSALIIFCFGLFHGLGFASVMGELPFRISQLMKVILYFNVGVELGQLVIVITAFGILFALRKAAQYQSVFLVGGSAAAALIAMVWFVQRAFGL